MASPTEVHPLCVDDPTQYPTDIFEGLEDIEKGLVRLKWVHKGSNLQERDIQELLKLVQFVKKKNQKPLNSINQTKKEDEKKEMEAKESAFYVAGGSQSVFVVGGFGHTKIHSTNSPITFGTPENDPNEKK